MNVIKTYDFNGKTLTVQIINSVLYFSAPELSEILGYARTESITKLVDEDEKLIRQTGESGQKRDTWFVSESALYEIIIKSTKSDTKPFKKWITKAVIPSIRKAGSYSTKKDENFALKVYEFTETLAKLNAEKKEMQTQINNKRKEIEDITIEMIQFVKQDKNQILLEFPEEEENDN